MKIIAGVIGCGNISRFHFSGLEKAGATVRWVCDRIEENARPYARRWDAKYTADWQQVVSDPQVNMVVMTAPSALHKAICLAAIAAGKAVVCEKTLSENATDSLEIVRAAAARETIFYTSYMKRFIPAVVKAKELLPSLGTIVSTHIRAHQCWGNLWDVHPERGLFHTPAGGVSAVRRNYGGGILMCGGSHLLDLVCFFLGRPSTVYAGMVLPAGRDYDLHAHALMKTAKGTVNLEAWAHPLNTIGFLRDGWDERIEINATRGRLEIFSAQWDNPLNKSSLLVHTDGRSGQVTEYRFDPESPFDAAMEFFCRQIARGEQGTQPIETGYDVDYLLEAIQESATTDRVITLNWLL